MPFLHPILFWLGLGGVAVPVIIHILNRRRFRVMDWAAMSFLIQAMRKNRRRLLLEELILLLLRCLIVLLAGLAMARFVGCGALQRLGVREAGRDIVYVLDDSYSLAQTRGEQTLFDRATDDLAERLAATSNRDRLAILQTSQPSAERALLPMGQLTNRQALTERLASLEPSDLRTSLAEALGEARRLLAGSDRPRRVVLLSDFRKIDLTDEQAVRELAEAAGDLREDRVELVALDYGQAAKRNLTLQGLELQAPFAVVGRPVSVSLQVRNNGSGPARNVPVKLSATFHDGTSLQTLDVPAVAIENVSPGQVWRHSFRFTPELPGSTVLTASLPADELAPDNTASLSLRVRPGVRVLIVDGRANPTDPTRAGAFFLKTALDPLGDGAHGFVVDVLPRRGLAGAAFEDYDVVFLVSVPDFPVEPLPATDERPADDYAGLLRLEQYVRDGGGLVLFTGPTIDVRFYNTRLYNRGLGLCPLPLRPARGDPQQRDTYWRLDPQSIRPTGLLRFFTGPLAQATQLVRFFAFNPADDAELQAGPDVSLPVVEARYDDRATGSPAVVSRTFGSGRVVLFTSTASMAWNDWAMDAVGDVQGLYVLFMADLTEQLARRQKEHFTGRVGEPLFYRLPAGLRDVTARLRPPGEGAESLPLELTAEERSARAVRFARPLRAGLWELGLRRPDGSEEQVLFARNPDPLEGQLEPGTRDHLAAALGGAEFVYLNRSRPTAAGEDGGEVSPYWKVLLLGLLLLLGVENYLARRFGHWE